MSQQHVDPNALNASIMAGSLAGTLPVGGETIQLSDNPLKYKMLSITALCANARMGTSVAIDAIVDSMSQSKQLRLPWILNTSTFGSVAIHEMSGSSIKLGHTMSEQITDVKVYLS